MYKRQVLNHVLKEGCSATIVIPRWKSAVFWPLLCQDGSHFRNEVVDWWELPRYDGMFIKGKLESKKSMFAGKCPPFRMLAVRFQKGLRRITSIKGFCSNGGCQVCENAVDMI